MSIQCYVLSFEGWEESCVNPDFVKPQRKQLMLWDEAKKIWRKKPNPEQTAPDSTRLESPWTFWVCHPRNYLRTQAELNWISCDQQEPCWTLPSVQQMTWNFLSSRICPCLACLSVNDTQVLQMCSLPSVGKTRKSQTSEWEFHKWREEQSRGQRTMQM